MARRAARSGMPLEWKTDVIDTTDDTVTNGVIDLDLLPDEIAEVWAIDTHMSSFLTSDADDLVVLSMYLSMDPDASGTPGTVAVLEDLETFYSHQASFQNEFAEATETGGAGNQPYDNKTLVLPVYPILIGTNPAQVVIGDASNNAEFITTIYFKRRRATASELNQILLKRR